MAGPWHIRLFEDVPSRGKEKATTLSVAFLALSANTHGKRFLVPSPARPAASAAIPSPTTRTSTAPAASTITPAAAGPSTASAAVSAMRPIALRRTITAADVRRSTFAVEVRFRLIGKIAAAFDYHRSR